jgi:hypothetical protein
MSEEPSLRTGPVERLLAKAEGTPNGIDALVQITRSPLALDACNAIISQMAIDGHGEAVIRGAVIFTGRFINVTLPTKKSKPLPVQTLIEES